MKTKLELAHEYVIKTIGLGGYKQEHMCRAIEIGWNYADAMYEQQKERELKGVPEAILKASKSNGLNLESITHDIDCYFDNANNTKRDADNLIQSIYEQMTGEVKTSDIGDWQPDWSQAPDGVTKWVMNDDKSARWVTVVDGVSWYQIAPSFNYRGGWEDSLRKRPEGE